MSILSRPFVRGALAALTLLVPVAAQASPNYPAALQEAAGLDCTPSCIVCHTVDPGTSGSAKQPFAIAMGTEGGLLPGDKTKVQPAFDTLSALEEPLDSDDDGTPDVEEVANGTNPNVSGDASVCVAEIKNGCGAHIAQRPGPSQWYGPLLLSVLVLMVFRRRRA